MVACPICLETVKEADINRHIDSNCKSFIDDPSLPPPTQANAAKPKNSSKAAGFFTPAAKKNASFKAEDASSPAAGNVSTQKTIAKPALVAARDGISTKRSWDDGLHEQTDSERVEPAVPVLKKTKNAHAPLAERMRPQTLDDVAGQDLVGPNGVLRNLIETDRVPSMILWGGPGTGEIVGGKLAKVETLLTSSRQNHNRAFDSTDCSSTVRRDKQHVERRGRVQEALLRGAE